MTFATKVCLWHFAAKYYNFWYRKSTEREEIKRKWGNLESEFLSTSSFSLHFLFIFSFSLHFLEGRRATQVRDNHNKFRSILNNRKDKHQRYRWEMHITQWRQSTCLPNPWVISVTAHKSCVCVCHWLLVLLNDDVDFCEQNEAKSSVFDPKNTFPAWT